MNSMKVKFAILILIAGLLSACTSPSTAAPASAPTEAAAPAISSPQATEAPTDVPAATDTSAAIEISPTAESAPAGATVSFATDIRPILESRCINCHGGDKIEEGLILTSHAGIMTGSENGTIVSPGDAANSLLAELVANKKMPKRGPKLTPPQVQLIVDWINQGALNN